MEAKTMKRFLFALLASVAMTSAAAAADMAVKAIPSYDPQPYPTWTGWYVGVNAGYANDYNQDVVGGTNRIGGIVVATGLVPSTLNTRASGWLAGGTAGYNYQFSTAYGGLVAGLETDFDWSGLSGSASQTLTTAPLGLNASLSTAANRGSDWLGTFRARIGSTALNPGTLFYITGGLAYADQNGSTSVTLKTPIRLLNATATDSFSGGQIGYVVGGGVETMLTQHWSVKAEYLYANFGSHNGGFGATIVRTPIAFSDSVTESESIVRAGVNYKF
jgi:outer membrane immunogenic protein